jgi:hypothetical protein
MAAPEHPLEEFPRGIARRRRRRHPVEAPSD